MSSMTVAAALAAQSGGGLPSGTRILDTARLVAESFDALLPLANSGNLAGIDFSNGGTPSLLLTPAQVTADAAVLALVAQPYSLQQRITAAEAGSATLQPQFEALGVWDTAANIAAGLPAIEALYRQGTLGLVRMTDSSPPPAFQLTAAQVAANIDALRAIGSPFTIALTDPGTPTVTLPVWADGDANYSTVLASITTPFVLHMDGVMRANRLAGIVSGINRSSSAETSVPVNPIAPFGPNSTALVPSNLTILDYQGRISGFIESLQAAAAAGKLTAIDMRDGGVQVLSLTPAQLTASPDAVALFSPNVQFSQVITAAQAAAPTLDARFANFTVEDTVANVLANIPAIDALMRAGQLGKLRYTEATADISMTAAQLGQAALVMGQAFEDPQSIKLTDGGTPTVTVAGEALSNSNVRANVLNLVAGSYSLVVTGVISAGTAATILSENNKVLASLAAGGLRIADYASNIVSNIAALHTLAGQGKIAAIDLLNGGVPGLGISNGTATTNADVLALITSPFSVAAAPTQTPQSLTAAQMIAQLDTLEASARANTLGTITLTDAGTPTLDLTVARFAATAEALSKIGNNYAINLTDSSTVSLAGWQMTGALAVVLNHVNFAGTPGFVITGAMSSFAASQIAINAGVEASFTPAIQVVEFASNIGTNIANLQTLASQGRLAGITLVDNGVGRVVLTAAQASANAGALAAIGSPFTLALNVTAAGAAGAVLPAGFDGLQVVDSLSNIQSNLDALEPLAVGGKLLGVSFTGSSPFTFNLTAAEVGANAEVLLRAGTNYTINLTDGGTPTITLKEWQLAANIANLLNRITSPYALSIDGPIRPQRVGTIVAAGAGVYNHLAAGSLVIRDYPTGFRGRMGDIQTLVNAGKVASIDTRGGRPPFSLDAGQETSFANVLALIDTPYTLSQYVTVAGIAAATLNPGFRDFTVLDTVANVLAGLSQVQALATANKLGRLQYTDAAPRLTLSAATLVSGLDAFGLEDSNGYPIELTDAGVPTVTVPAYLMSNYYVRNNVLDAIATPWHLAVSGRVSVQAAAAVAAENNNVKSHLTTKLDVAGYNFDILPYLGHLHVMNQAGLINSIDMLDTAAPVFAISAADAASYADVLGLIHDPFILSTGAGSTAESDVAGLARLSMTGFDSSSAIDVRDMGFAPSGVSFTFAGGTLTVLRGGTPLGAAGVAAAGGVTYDEHSFYIEPDGTGGTRIRATQSPIAVTDTTANTSFITGGDFYSGAVGYLQRQFINPTGHSVNVGANIPNVFLHGGGAVGNNALQALSGDNVIDGGIGSNFLVGGANPAGFDTFFLDGRGGQVSWGTVVNFHHGDAVTFWGWNESTNRDWFANDGAPGFQGATIHARLQGGSGAYDASITFAGIDLATAQGFTFSTGTVGGSSYAYFQFT